MITRLEELSNNAWPASQNLLYDGWILRFAEGYTKRANSVQPIYNSTLDIKEKLQYCEEAYSSKNLSTVFKLTSAVYPENLDSILESEGYVKDSPTSVQLLKIHNADKEVCLAKTEYSTSLDEWLNNCCRLINISENNKPVLRQILMNIVPKSFFAYIKDKDEVIACGLGILQNGYIGLFDIVVDERFRKRGYGRQIVNSIIRLGAKNGADKAYLQVMLNNPPALKLYESIGFKEVYQYWYRVKK